jgi:hypothetical protein
MTELILSIKEKHFPFLEKLNLKKVLFFTLILGLILNPTEIGSIARLAVANAYLSVSVFVAITLFVFLYLEKSKTYSLSNFFKTNVNLQIPIASLLGAIPGCGGAIIVVTQYLQGNITFGCLVAVLTSTMGDAAFLILAKEPMSALLIFFICMLVGIISGFIINYIIPNKYTSMNISKINLKLGKIQNKYHLFLYKLWLIVFIPGFFLGVLGQFQIDLEKILNFNINYFLGLGASLLAIFVWSINPFSDRAISLDTSRNIKSKSIDMTNFVTVWVVVGFLFFDLGIYITGIDFKKLFDIMLPLTPLLAIFVGLIPGCGPQLLTATLYLNGYIPFSAEIGNAISNDGDALFPAIAICPKEAILATIYSFIPAIIVAYSYFFIFEN